MPNLNKVMLMGNLTRDPELRFTGNNTPVCKLGLAINRRWTDRNTNEKHEETTFVDCTAFGRQAEVINQYLQKGRPVYIEGRLNLGQWKDQQGNNRSKLDVIIEHFEFLGGPRDDRQGGGGGYTPSSGSGAGGGTGRGSSPPPPSSNAPAHQPVDDDDIPF